MQTELEEEKALQLLRSHDRQQPPQVITVKTEDEIDSNKLVLPILNAKSEPELEQWLVRARKGLQSAARDSGLSFFAKAEAVGKIYVVQPIRGVVFFLETRITRETRGKWKRK